MEKLPENFVIKSNIGHPLWEKFIEWLQKNGSAVDGSGKTSYYGRNCNKYGVYLGYTSDNLIDVITLEQWDEAVNGFKLPEKWCVKVTKENAVILGEFYAKHAWDGYRELISDTHIGRYYTSHNITSKVSIFSKYPESNFSLLAPTAEFPEITFEQFKKYVLKQDNMKEKEIIGYKLKEDCKQYEEASIKIIAPHTKYKEANKFSEMPSSDIPDCLFVKRSYSKELLEKAGVLDLWFEPVYKEEKFKVGDWVVVTKYIDEDNIGKNYFKIGDVFQIDEIQRSNNNYIGKWIYSKSRIISINSLRKATPEEIKKATEVVFEAGTWVVITSLATTLDSFHVGGIYKLRERFGTNYGNFRVEADDDGDENGYGMDVVNYFTNEKYKIGVRAATQEEIDKATEPKVTKLYFGDVLFTIEKGKYYATTKYGKVTEQELEHAIDYIEHPPKLIEDYPLTIHSYIDDTYMEIKHIDKFSSSIGIGFGCKSGKLSELKEILKVIKNGRNN